MERGCWWSVPRRFIVSSLFGYIFSFSSFWRMCEFRFVATFSPLVHSLIIMNFPSTSWKNFSSTCLFDDKFIVFKTCSTFLHQELFNNYFSEKFTFSFPFWPRPATLCRILFELKPSSIQIQVPWGLIGKWFESIDSSVRVGNYIKDSCLES